jgi:hypothetical protein
LLGNYQMQNYERVVHDHFLAASRDPTVVMHPSSYVRTFGGSHSESSAGRGGHTVAAHICTHTD